MKTITIAAIAAGYLYFFPFFAHLRNPNENVRVYMVLAIVDQGTFALNHVIARYGPVDDRSVNVSQSCAGASAVERCTYSSKAPGVSYLGVPVYGLLRLAYAAADQKPDLATTIYVLRLFCVILPSVLFLWAFWRFLGRYLRRSFDRLLIVGTLALGTMSFTYAHLFAGHQLVAVLVFGSFMLIERARQTGKRLDMFAAGFAAAFAGITEYPAVFAGAFLLVYAALRMRGRCREALALFAAGAVGPALLGALYHQICFGRPWRTGYGMLANPAYADFHRAGLFGIGRPSIAATWYSLFSPARGLFFFAPSLLLGVAGLLLLWRQRHRAEAVLGTTMVLFYIAYQSAVNPEIGGWSIGPRYIVLVTPFLALGAGAFLEATGDRWLPLYGLAIPLCALSIGYTFLSTVVFHTFPEVFTNPFYEWVLPLIRMGYFNYSLGTWLGLRGTASALPGVLPVGLMLVLFCAGPASFTPSLRVAGAATAALVVSVLFTGFSHLQRFDTVAKEGEFQRLIVLWEPAPVTDADLADAWRDAEARPDAADAQAHLARLLAGRGRWQEALERYARAAGALDRSGPARR